MAKSKVTLAQVFKTIIWPRRGILLVGLVLIVVGVIALGLLGYLFAALLRPELFS